MIPPILRLGLRFPSLTELAEDANTVNLSLSDQTKMTLLLSMVQVTIPLTRQHALT